MIYIQGLALILLIALWSRSRDASTMLGYALGGLVGVALIIAVMAFTNELNRDYLRDYQPVMFSDR